MAPPDPSSGTATVLLLEPIHPEAHARLEAACRVLLEEDQAAAEALVRHTPVEAVITRGRGQVRRRLFEACPSLRVVARVGVGLDNVDLDAATAHGVRVLNLPGSTTVSVAEHTLLLIQALLRGFYPLVHAVRGGHWEVRRGYLGDDLAGKTLGLVGMGEIGARVARLGAAYDMDVCYWNRTPKNVPYRHRPLDHLLAEADVVSLHVALTPGTHHLIDRQALARMKPGAYLVNTARGGIVDQAAVRDALDAGALAGYGTDVLDPEPPAPGEPLLAHPKTLVTPHTAALTAGTFRRMSLRTADNVLALLRGAAPEEGCVANAHALAAAGMRA